MATAVSSFFAWAKELPNIIYIVTDQQTASAMSCMGNDDLHTPNMDKLAQAGVLFRNAYCSTPLSGPARAAMFTGYTSHEVGLARNGTPIPDSLRTRTLGTLMQNAGYDCIYAGKWHVHTASMPDKEFGFTTTHLIVIMGWRKPVSAFWNKNIPNPSSWWQDSITRIIFVSTHVARICLGGI